MTPKQAKALSDHIDNGNHVLFNAGPYINKIGTGTIDADDVYRDDTYINIKLSEHDPEDFDVYIRIENWWEQ